MKGWTATRLDTSTSCTSCVEASTISLEFAWTGGRKQSGRDANKHKRDKLLCHQGDGSDCVLLHERSCKSDLVDGKRHNDVGLLVNDFCFASWVTQVRLHLEISKHEPIQWKLQQARFLIFTYLGNKNYLFIIRADTELHEAVWSHRERITIVFGFRFLWNKIKSSCIAGKLSGALTVSMQVSTFRVWANVLNPAGLVQLKWKRSERQRESWLLLGADVRWSEWMS